MDKRMDTSRLGPEQILGHPKKNKKRSNKKDNYFGHRVDDMPNDQVDDLMPGIDFPHVLWQSNVQQNLPNHNGQRLFTAISDPSVCGYSPMPVTYAMEPVSLPSMYRLYQPVPVPNIRTIHGRPRQTFNQNHSAGIHPNPNVTPNGYTSLQENGFDSPIPPGYQNGDYTSLPPTANKNNGINGEELNSEHRRYSDPGLGPAEAPHHGQSDDSDSIDSGSSITTIGRNNKLILSLIEQITELKKNNSQLFKELSEAKFDIENMKVKLAQYKNIVSPDYQPGMLSDLIREIREANKMCEERLVAKVKCTMEEEQNQRAMEVEQLKSQLSKLAKEKEESDKRFSKLEEEVATLKLNANIEGREIAAFEEETLALRRELQEARASRNLAESDAAKCVNAVARSVTPVTFEMPRITSTPVRTAISDTCSILPPSTTLASSSIPRVSSDVSATRSRSTEVMALLVADRKNLRPNAQEKEICRRNLWTIDDDDHDDDHNHNDDHDDRNVPDDLPFVPVRNPSLESDRNLKSEDERTCADSKDEPANTCEVKKSELKENGVESTTDKPSEKNPCEENKDIMDNIRNGEIEESANNSSDRKNLRVQRGSFKKPRRKRAAGSIKRSFSETDKRDVVTPVLTGVLANGGLSRKGIVRRTMSEDEAEDEGSLKVERTGERRAITEIPEVTVIGGGSFVPKNLCSTRILTSRVLTAPSRATYTTTYI